MRKVFLMMLLATVFIVGCGKKANDGNVCTIPAICNKNPEIFFDGLTTIATGTAITTANNNANSES